jgi:hypothetical protein
MLVFTVTLTAPCKLIMINIQAYGTVMYQVVRPHIVAATHVLVIGINIWSNILSLSNIKY